MFDIQRIRDQKEDVIAGLAAKKVTADLDAILQHDQTRRDLQTRQDELRHTQKTASDAIARLKKSGQDAADQIAAMKDISNQISALDAPLKEAQKELNKALLGLPNLPHASVPVGGEDQNQIIRSWGEPARLDFPPKDHLEIAERLDIIDFKRATKLSGSNFILFKGAGARLQRALINFMLDLHTKEHGFREMHPPVLVNRESMTGTGQLPKMEDDMYRLDQEDLFLIPTAEVPVTNIHRDEVLNEDDLPLYYTAYTSCFRREAGSYGKDTKGLMRVHQFDKVELVKFVKPESSYDELQQLVNQAEIVFQRLGIPYRILLLASGDLSFAAAKCFDIEVHACGLNKWLEASSCSNFESFQARRANIRYKGKTAKKPQWIHTLNGSGVALPRTMIAILENYQTQEGDVIIPEALRPYMGGLARITPER